MQIQVSESGLRSFNSLCLWAVKCHQNLQHLRIYTYIHAHSCTHSRTHNHRLFFRNIYFFSEQYENNKYHLQFLWKLSLWIFTIELWAVTQHTQMSEQEIRLQTLFCFVQEHIAVCSSPESIHYAFTLKGFTKKGSMLFPPYCSLVCTYYNQSRDLCIQTCNHFIFLRIFFF